MTPTTHIMRDGLCLTCGETADWLAATNATVVDEARTVLPVGESFDYKGARHVVTSHMNPGGAEVIMLAAKVGSKRSRRFTLEGGVIPKAL